MLVKVLQDGLMATLDDARHKLGGAGVGDFVLRLIADPPAQLNVLEDSLPARRRCKSRLFCHATSHAPDFPSVSPRWKTVPN